LFASSIAGLIWFYFGPVLTLLLTATVTLVVLCFVKLKVKTRLETN